MYISLFAVTFSISVIVCAIIVRIFRKPVDSILDRIIADSISKAWSTYLRFAIFVTGISGGVNLRKIEQYITAPQSKNGRIVELTPIRWLLEIYRTIIETLQGIAWMLLVFFLFALIAFVIVRAVELIKTAKEKAHENA
jgi:hypothetical protein